MVENVLVGWITISCNYLSDVFTYKSKHFVLPFVSALYKAEESPSNWFYAGIIAEPANIRNNNR